MENILSRKRQLPHLKLMLIYIYGVKWLIFIISTGIQVGHMTSAKPLYQVKVNTFFITNIPFIVKTISSKNAH